MVALKTEIFNILNLLAMNPANMTELVIIIFLSLIGAQLVLKVAAKPLGYTMAYTDRATLCVLVPYVLSIVSVAALKVFLFAKVANPKVQIAIIAIVLIVILFAVAMTMCKMVMKGGYFTALAPIIFSVVAAGLITLVVKYAITTIKGTAKDFGKTKARTEAINSEIPK